MKNVMLVVFAVASLLAIASVPGRSNTAPSAGERVAKNVPPPEWTWDGIYFYTTFAACQQTAPYNRQCYQAYPGGI